MPYTNGLRHDEGMDGDRDDYITRLEQMSRHILTRALLPDWQDTVLSLPGPNNHTT
jgi:hypothetical protein